MVIYLASILDSLYSISHVDEMILAGSHCWWDFFPSIYDKWLNVHQAMDNIILWVQFCGRIHGLADRLMVFIGILYMCVVHDTHM